MKPVSRTAFYCGAVRMWDAEAPEPICGDQFARVFMTDEAREFVEPFRESFYPNATNVARHRVIDDLLRAHLAADPSRRVIVIGAGFDTRAYRLPGGRWVELDEPQVIDHKEPRLPAGSAPNPLERIPIDFATERLADKLAPFRADRSVTVVVEGVTMYLTRAQLEGLLDTLAEIFPRHSLICDMFTATFIRRYGARLKQRLTDIGATFGDLFDDPEPLFRTRGYRPVKVISIVREARRLGAIPIPLWLINTAFRSMANGYRIWEWERRAGAG